MVNGPTRGDHWGGWRTRTFWLHLWHRYISYDSTITGGCLRGRGANVLISVRLLSINSQRLITVHRIEPCNVHNHGIFWIIIQTQFSMFQTGINSPFSISTATILFFLMFKIARVIKNLPFAFKQPNANKSKSLKSQKWNIWNCLKTGNSRP